MRDYESYLRQLDGNEPNLGQMKARNFFQVERISLIFWTRSVLILTGTPTIPPFFFGLKAPAGLVPQIGLEEITSILFPIHKS
jgi:hypothetical protein